MKYQVVSVRDLAIQTFGQPVFVAHIGAAIRSFGDECKREGSPMQAHPTDFELWHVAEFDDEKGDFLNLPPERIARGTDYSV